MKTNLSPLGVGLRCCGVLAALALAGCTTYVHEPPRTVYVPTPAPPPPPPATVVVPPPDSPTVVIQSEADFYQPLDPYGSWVVVGTYGRCWRPARVDPDWRPYCNGTWRRTDAGWYWASEEPWGWATYHYGRWDWSIELGWFWVPHVQWAPAWVCWRQGAGYVGWAPLPPSAKISVHGVLEIHERAIAPRSFVFVSEQRLLEPLHPTTVIVNNTTIVNQTVNITKVQVVNNTVIAEGPRPEVIERRSGRRVEAVPTRDLRRQEETRVITARRSVPAAAENAAPPAGRNEAGPARAIPSRESQPRTATPENRGAAATSPATPPPRSTTVVPPRTEPQREANSPRPSRDIGAAPQPAARPADPAQGRPAGTAPGRVETARAPQSQPAATGTDRRANGDVRPSGPDAHSAADGARGHERQRALDRGTSAPAGRTNAAPPSRTSTDTKQVNKGRASGKPAPAKPADAGKRKKEKKEDGAESETRKPKGPQQQP